MPRISLGRTLLLCGALLGLSGVLSPPAAHATTLQKLSLD